MEKYNGWTNYPTWAVNAWIDNDERDYLYWQNVAKKAESVEELAERLKAEHEENAPELETGVYSELLGFALDSVNWLEIAEALRDE